MAESLTGQTTAVHLVADCDMCAAMQYRPHLLQRATAASGASRAATSMARTLTRRAWRWPALTQVCPWHFSSSARFCGPPVGHCRAHSSWPPPRPSCHSLSAVIACPASPQLPASQPVCARWPRVGLSPAHAVHALLQTRRRGPPRPGPATAAPRSSTCTLVRSTSGPAAVAAYNLMLHPSQQR